MLEELIKQTLNKPIVIDIQQLENIQIFIRETEEGIETISLEEYIVLKVVDKLVTLMNRGE